MTVTVSISDFRDDISGYLERIKRGDFVVIRDEKKGVNVAEVTAVKKFDQKKYAADYKKMLRSLKGIRAKDHPEWATQAKVEKWLRQTRMNAERSFDVPPGQ